MLKKKTKKKNHIVFRHVISMRMAILNVIDSVSVYSIAWKYYMYGNTIITVPDYCSVFRCQTRTYAVFTYTINGKRTSWGNLLFFCIVLKGF